MKRPPRTQAVEQARAKVDEYLPRFGNCAQTSFLSLQEVFGLEEGGIVKALTPFPGIALRGETCGAVIGSLMVLGLLHGRGRDDPEGTARYRASLTPAREFCRRFAQECGSTMCGDIVERLAGRRFDLADPEEAAEWRRCGAAAKCTGTVRSAVRIAAELITDEAG